MSRSDSTQFSIGWHPISCGLPAAEPPTGGSAATAGQAVPVLLVVSPRRVSGDRAPAEEVRREAEAPVSSVEVDVAVGAEADGEGQRAADGHVGSPQAAGEEAPHRGPAR